MFLVARTWPVSVLVLQWRHPAFGQLLQIQHHFRLGYSSLILGNHLRFRLSSHYFRKLGVELRSLDEESVQLLRLRNCSDEQVPGQVLLKVSGANPRSLHPLLNIPPEPLDPLHVNLRFAGFDKVLLMVNRVVTVPEFAELTISRPGIRVDDAAGPNKLLDDRNLSVSAFLLDPYSPFRGTTKRRFDARSIPPNNQTWFKTRPLSYFLRTIKVSSTSTSTPTPPIGS
ncbi:hypothetical protein ElyMa_000752500 [Elysia marginata]|uniref:Uncharacterized protein n=1 Tax=Elysia marginata TaxID=1093978 RepID=A0AAV4GPK4_9GAST|nr:hypothetical protein ElyMa_000752500 [Elysia marginata]